MHLRAISSALLLLLAGCARPAPAGKAAPAAAATEGHVTPFGDYHAHLSTAVSLALVYPPALPEVEVPAQLAPLLRERERLWNDPAGLAALYTEESLAFTSRNRAWLRGRAEVAEYMGTLFARPYRIFPTRVEVGDSVGFIAGYYTRPVEGGIRYFGHAHLSLRREADGAWRIAGETASFPGPDLPEQARPERLIALLDAGGVR
ncbi:MAG TPA: hypothetical protein VFQ45_01750, partial [Longimicrobium sp.]|nr:hypothetical protein [Longimicrobium sp.]